MELFIKKYSDLDNDEKRQITNLISRGGEVNQKTLPERLAQTAMIAFLVEDNLVIATASVKIPTKGYKLHVFSESNSNISIDEYIYELGYVMVDEQFRSLKFASKLCSELCRVFLADRLFATTRTNNISMQAILLKNNFSEIGQVYLNRDNTSLIKLFVKQ